MSIVDSSNAEHVLSQTGQTMITYLNGSTTTCFLTLTDGFNNYVLNVALSGLKDYAALLAFGFWSGHYSRSGQ